MAKEREIVSAKSGEIPVTVKDLISELAGAKTDAEKEVAQKKLEAKLRVQVLDRGVVNQRLNVDLPSDVYGEWVTNTKDEIYRMESMGFEIDSQYAPSRALHSEGDGKSIVGDVVFMTCPKVVKESIDKIRRTEYMAMNMKKKTMREESNFIRTNAEQGLGEGSSLVESEASLVSGTEIGQMIEKERDKSPMIAN
jgi:hypothetical protein